MMETVSNIQDREARYTSGFYAKRDSTITRGQGALLWDETGRQYIDCIAGIGVANVGHCHPAVVAAITTQAQRLITCPEIFYNDQRAQLEEMLVQVSPEGLNRVFLCNSGTESMEAAMKIARLSTGRPQIISTMRSFHGRSFGALSLTGNPKYQDPFAPLLPDTLQVPYNKIAALQDAVSEKTAAVVLELVQGEGGIRLADPQYIADAAALCRERGALLIIDEIQTGIGRTGNMFACEHYHLSPDILCTAKALGGGIPIGATLLGDRVQNIQTGLHGSTFGGNPLAAAAALATLRVVQEEGLAVRAEQLGKHALEKLGSHESPIVREVRGLGLMVGVELRTNKVGVLLDVLHQRGVLALLAGPTVLRLLPPLVITEEQWDMALDAVLAALHDSDVLEQLEKK